MKPKLFFLLLLLTFTLSLVATATVRYVSKTGSATSPYTSWATASDSIQKCINICQSGDTVYVANGVYKENLIINKEIALIGSSMDSTVIDGTGLAVITVYYYPAGVGGSFENFKVTGKGFNQGACILTERDIIVKNCRLTQDQGGISIFSSTRAENLIIDDVSTGVRLGGFIGATVRNCIIYLSVSNSGGISIGGEGIFYIENNIITSLAGSGTIGILISWINRTFIRNNLISGFENNIYSDIIEDTSYIINNLSLHKLRTNMNSQGSIYAQNDPVIIKNNIFKSNANTAVNGNTPYVSLNYNMYWDNNNDLYGLSYGDSDRVADPMFIKDTIPTSISNYDYHLQAFSPAIDKGDPNLLDVDGTRSDMGMHGGPFGEITYYKDLAPKPPRNLSVIVDTNKVIIKWKKNTEADTSHYKVYRDTVQNFIVDSTKLIASPKDTFYIHPPLPIGRYYYKVSCVDKQGNESRPSEEIAVNITNMNDYPMTINDYLLFQNYPNPFNPSTTIGYKLKERGYVKLMVYDIKGELVSVLVNQEQEAGYYEIGFDVKSQKSKVKNDLASGIYLYRIEVIGDGNIPVYTEMKKMLLVK